jgi:adenine-specific DNA glycosylase
VIQQSLGGLAIPVDDDTRRVLVRLGSTAPVTDIPTLRAMLDRAVSKNRGVEFLDLIEDLAHDTCVAGEPDCPRCELRKICPTARLHLQQDGESASETHREEAQARKPHAPKGPKEAKVASAKPAKEAPPSSFRPPKGKHGDAK